MDKYLLISATVCHIMKNGILIILKKRLILFSDRTCYCTFYFVCKFFLYIIWFNKVWEGESRRYMKKYMAVILAVILVLQVLSPGVIAETSTPNIILNQIPDKMPGDEVTITGTTNLTEVNIKVITPDSTILYVDVTEVTNDIYSSSFRLPANIAIGTYTAVAGRGTAVAVKQFKVNPPPPPSSDASLSALTLSGITLTPSFNSGIKTYTASVGNSVTTTTVAATANDKGATITAADLGLKTLVVGPNIITVHIKAADGTTDAYTVTVTRAASSDASLNSLNLSAGILAPVFTTGTTSYTASVGNEVPSITLTPAAHESHAAIRIDGIAVNSGSPSGVIDLQEGVTKTIYVEVTAQDGTTRIYTLSITRMVKTAAGTLEVSSVAHATGISPARIELKYTLAEQFSNGQIIINLPCEFAARKLGDTISTSSGQLERLLTADEISPDGQKITLNGVNLFAGDYIYLYLNDRTLPAVGIYNFNALSDGDGLAPLKDWSSGSGNEAATFNVTPAQTIAGNLVVEPFMGIEGSSRTITLSYTPGETMNGGSLVYTLPEGFSANTRDKITAGEIAERSLSVHEISDSGKTVTINGATTTASQKIILALKDKTLPIAKDYSFSVTADADGLGPNRVPSAGTGNEIKTFTVSVPSNTAAGTLEISPNTGKAGDSAARIDLKYTAGEQFSNGQIVFNLPSGFEADFDDCIITGVSEEIPLSADKISPDGKTVTLSGLSLSAGDHIYLYLYNKTLPMVGTYNVNAAGDADGTAAARAPSAGTGSEAATFIVTPAQTIAGNLGIEPFIGITGDAQTVTLSYTPGEIFTGASLVYQLPEGFSATTADTLTAGNSGRSLTVNEISGNGQTITINGINAAISQKIILSLADKTLPAQGTYSFSVTADADGAGPNRVPSAGTGNEIKNFTVSVPSNTAAGTLEISPNTGKAGDSAARIDLKYTAGEQFSNGQIIFNLPSGFKAGINTGDSYYNKSTNTGRALTANEIIGGKVTLNGISLSAGDYLYLHLYDKTLPSAGTYNVNAMGDADGTAAARAPSSGAGSEAAAFTVTPAQTIAGRLGINPSLGIAGDTHQTVTLTYTLGESFIEGKGSLIFTLPEGFSASTGNKVTVGGSAERSLTTNEISSNGKIITISGINAAVSQNIILSLKDKTLPIAGNYNFSAAADADGTDGNRTPSTGIGSESMIFTIAFSVNTINGSLSIEPASGRSGANFQDIYLNYITKEGFNNGSVIFNLPVGFEAKTNDLVGISGGQERFLSLTELTQNGRVVTINGVTANENGYCRLVLKNRTLPTVGTYNFSVRADADGSASAKNPTSGTGSEAATFSVTPSLTKSGKLEVNPSLGVAGEVQKITLKYTPGEEFRTGKIIINLPAGFMAAATDTIATPPIGERLLTSSEISNGSRTITINGISVNTSQQIILSLNNKILPIQGTYNFNVTADADGPGTDRDFSLGTGNEISQLVIVKSLPPTASGQLAIDPDFGITGTIKTIYLDYTFAEGFNNGTLKFYLPAGFEASSENISTLVGKAALSSDGRIVTITGVTAGANAQGTLVIKEKDLPAPGIYQFSVSADADGSGMTKGNSLGTGTEVQTFVVGQLTTPGNLTADPLTGIAGSTQTISLTYTPGETFSAGHLVFKLPEGFSASTEDKVKINDTERSLSTDEISENGKTIIIGNLNVTASQKIALQLINKTMPVTGNYSFAAAADADGTDLAKGPSLGTGNEVKSLTITTPLTRAGLLDINPTEVRTGNIQNITLKYVPGEKLNQGTMVFNLPNGFAATNNDTITIPGNLPRVLNISEIGTGGTTVTIKGLSCDSTQFVLLSLISKTIPGIGEYTFSVRTDADGLGSTRDFSAGNGSEAKICIVNNQAPPATQSGSLKVTKPSDKIAIAGISQDIELTYELGDAFNSGTVSFTLPTGITAAANDKIAIAGGQVRNLLATEIFNGGSKVTVDNISAAKAAMVVLTLIGEKMSAQGIYKFSAVGDADGLIPNQVPSAGDGNEISFLTVIYSSGTTAGILTIDPSTGITGTNAQNISLEYELGETFNKGILIFSLPAGLEANTGDGISVPGANERALATGEISNEGRTVTINNVTADISGLCKLTLKNRTLPLTGGYSFSIIADADGLALAKGPSSGTNNELRTLTITSQPTQTGNLEISHSLGLANSIQDITLTYTPGETLVNANLMFNLPGGFTAAVDDKVTVGTNSARSLNNDEIGFSGHGITINSININPAQTVVLSLKRKTLPVQDNYLFNARADSDGPGVIKDYSSGIGKESKTIKVVNSLPATSSGTLSLTPDTNRTAAKIANIVVDYIMGEEFNNGRLTYCLPAGFEANAGDSLTTYLGESPVLTSGEISADGRTVTISGLTSAAYGHYILNLKNKTLPAAGDYTFRVTGEAYGAGTAKGPSLGTGSEMQIFTVTPPLTAAGMLDISPSLGIVGISQNVEFRYTPGEVLNNGKLLFTLPEGFTANNNDSVAIGNSAARNLTADEISSEGHVISINGINLTTLQAVTFTLSNKTMPLQGSYSFSVMADADGSRTTKDFSSGSGNEIKKFTIANSTKTNDGILVIDPANSSALAAGQNIFLDYTLGERFSNGTIVFNLPAGFEANTIATFTSPFSSERNLITAEISSDNRTVTISGVSSAAGGHCRLVLKNRTLPTRGLYTFGAIADADGAALAKTQSSGIGSEAKTLTINPALTISGTLELQPSLGIANSTNQMLILNYIPGEAFIGGSIIFKLPGELSVSTGDKVKVGGNPERNLSIDEIHGSTITIRDINTAQSQQIILKLLGETLPAAGNYNFSVSSDADGSAEDKQPSTGTGSELKTFTVASSSKTSSGILTLPVNTGITGTNVSRIDLKYNPGEDLNNGTIVFTLPDGITVSATDTIMIGLNSPRKLSANEITANGNGGYNVEIGGLNASSSGTNNSIYLQLLNKTLPVSGAYTFGVIADADGLLAPAKTASSGTGSETAAFIVKPAITAAGTLEISPSVGIAGKTQTVNLSYTPGEDFNGGQLVFNLPTGFSAAIGDTVTIGDNTPQMLDAGAITNGGRCVTINGISINTSKKILLSLAGKIMPEKGAYNFSVLADADGNATLRGFSSGIGGEGKTLTVIVSQGPSASGNLSLPINRGTTGTTEGRIDLKYNPGEDINSGTVTFNLPSGFAISTLDKVIIGGNAPRELLPEEISGRKVTLNSVNVLSSGLNNSIYLQMYNKNLPSPGTYTFSVIVDADGQGLLKEPSIQTAADYTITPQVSKLGNMTVAGETLGNLQNLSVTYAFPEPYSNGEIELSLPEGYTVDTDDTISLGAGSPRFISPNEIASDGRKIIISGIYATKSQAFILSLKNKPLPLQGTYKFICKGDADGSGAAMSYSTPAQFEFVVEGKVPTPVAAVTPGTYNKAQNVALTSIEGAAIYYTTNGTTPTSASKKYVGAIPINTSTIIKAIAVKAKTSSEVGNYSYDIVVQPKATPDSGIYGETQTISLSSITSDASIYYTTDGTDPSTSSRKYTDSIQINSNTSIKAICVKSGVSSDIAVFNFEILTVPKAAPGTGTFNEPQEVKLSCTTPEAVIYYTLDGSKPTAASTRYTEKIDIAVSAAIKAIAVKNGVMSAVQSFNYIIDLKPTSILKIEESDNQSARVGTYLPQHLQVKVRAIQEPISGQKVHFEITGDDSGGASLDDGSQLNNQIDVITNREGQANIKLKLGSQAGKVQVRASTAGFDLIPSVTFSAHAQAWTPTRYQIMNNGQTAKEAGSILSLPLKVKVFNEEDRILPGAIVTFKVKEGGGSLLSSSASLEKYDQLDVCTNAEGEASVYLQMGPQDGIVTAAIKNSSLGSIDFTAKNTYTSLSPAAIQIYEGNNQVGKPGSILSKYLVVKVLNIQGGPVKNAVVAFTPTGCTISEKPKQTITDEFGNAWVQCRLGSTAGEQTVKVSVEGLQGHEQIFTINAKDQTRTPNKLEVLGDGQKGVPGVELRDPIGVRVLDADGLVISGQKVEFTITRGNGYLDKTFSTIEKTTDSNGMAFAALTQGEAGINEVVVKTVPDRLKTAVIMAAAVQDVKLTLLSQDQQVYKIGDILPIKVSVTDKYGAIKNIPLIWEVKSGTGYLNSERTTTDESGESSNTLNPKSDEIIVRIYPPGLETSAVTFRAKTASGFVISGNVKYYSSNMNLTAYGVKTDGSYQETKVNSNGSFALELDQGEWTIGLSDSTSDLLSLDQFQLPKARKIIVNNNGNIAFELIPFNHEITGRVVRDIHGQKIGIANAAVSLENPENTFWGSTAVTRDDGSFSLKAASGSYVLSYRAAGYNTAPQGSLRVDKDTQLGDLVLIKPGAIIKGNIANEGKPIKDAVVTAYDPSNDHWATTQSINGSYQLLLEPGQYQIKAQSQEQGDLVFSPDNDSNVSDNPIKIKDGDIIEEVNFVVPVNNGTIAGTVRRANEVVPGAVVTFTNTVDGICRKVITNIDGLYRIELPSSQSLYTVEVSIGPRLEMTSSVRVVIRTEQRMDLQLPELVQVRGKVITKNGTPVNDAIIVIAIGNSVFNTLKINPTNGQYDFMLAPNKPDESYEFTINSQSLGQISRTVKVKNSMYDLDFRYPENKYNITGKVMSRGTGMGGVWVSANGKNGISTGAYSAEQTGEFRLEAGPGQYTMGASRPGFIQLYDANTQPEIEVKDSSLTIQLDMKESQFGLSGSVKDYENHILPGAEVWIEDGNGGHLNATADSLGKYNFNLTAGKWYMGVVAEGFKVRSALKEDGTVLNNDMAVTVNGTNATKDIVLTRDERIELSNPTVISIDPQKAAALKNSSAGANVNIPASSLDTNDQVEMALKETSNVPETDKQKPINGRGIEIIGHDENGRPILKFKDDFTIQLSYTENDLAHLKEELRKAGLDFDEELLQLNYFNLDTQSWITLNATWHKTSNGGYFVGSSNHLTKFAIVYPNWLVLRGSQEPEPPKTKDEIKTPKQEVVKNKVSPGSSASLTSSDGKAKINIPPDAVSVPVEISMAAVKEDTAESGIVVQSSNKFASKVLGVYKLDAQDEKGSQQNTFKKPIEITINIGSAMNNVGLFYYDPVYKTLVPVRSQYNPKTGEVTGLITHFTLFVALVEREKDFVDIQNHWAKNSIEILSRKNVVNGTGDGQFSPEKEVTRAEFAVMLSMAAGVPGTADESGFIDVKSDYWAAVYIAASKKANIIGGYPDGTFHSTNAVTRAEAVTMLMKTLGTEIQATDNNLASFGDYSSNYWANKYLSAAVEKKILSGYPDGTLRPNQSVSRAEAAALINRLLIGF